MQAIKKGANNATHTQGWVRKAKQQQERSGAVVPYIGSMKLQIPKCCSISYTLPLLYIASLVHCLLYIASYILPLLYIASYILPLLFIASFTLPLLDIASYTLPFHIAFQLAIESCNTKTNAARL